MAVLLAIASCAHPLPRIGTVARPEQVKPIKAIEPIEEFPLETLEGNPTPQSELATVPMASGAGLLPINEGATASFSSFRQQLLVAVRKRYRIPASNRPSRHSEQS